MQPSPRKKQKTASQVYQKKTLKEQILLRPDTYIGPIDPVECDNDWIYDETTQKMKKATFQFSSAVFKIFDEILVNAIDATKVDPTVSMIKVEVDQDTGRISVWNNGQGIPVEMHETEQVWIPEMIFFHFLTSSNYDDTEQRVTGGRNGLGAKCSALFSKEFTVETADSQRHKKFRMTAKANLDKLLKPRITDYAKDKGFTRVTFLPDYERFGMSGIDHGTYEILRKRVFDASACTAKQVSVYWNKRVIPYKTLEKYAELYIGKKSERKRVAITMTCPDKPWDWEVIATVSDDGFQQVSFVNGISTSEGGTHVSTMVQQIVDGLAGNSRSTGLLQKRHKDITQKLLRNFVKSHLWLFVRATVVNPRFSSQTKEKLTSKVSEMGFRPTLSDKFLQNLMGCGFQERVVDYARYKNRGELKKTDGSKKIRLSGIEKLDDANKAGTRESSKCTLILTEGDSAKTLATSGVSVVGRDYFGIFPLRGKPLNVKDSSTKKLLANKEITYIKQILGLRQGIKYETDEEYRTLRYGHVLIMADQDLDGSHIKGLVFALFHEMWPGLLKRPGFIKGFLTPVVKVTNRKRKSKTLSFYTLRHFQNWRERTNGGKGWKIKYYKGLGTNTPQEAKQYFTAYDEHVLTYEWLDDQATDQAIDLAFSKKCIEDRKAWIQSYDPSIVLDNNRDKTVNFADFVHKDLIHYSVNDLHRSVPSLMDGLKPSLRKIIFGCFKRNLTYEADEIKVVQLAGYVSDKCGYHHGEESLNKGIIGLAQDYTGSNNINLLYPGGAFGTRVGDSKNNCKVGKDAASPRYIYTKLNEITPLIFNPLDNPLLDYEVDDDGNPVEPRFYVPLIPMILVNGCSGIGTGFSTTIPAHNPLVITRLLRYMIQDESSSSAKQQEDFDMMPWYRGFKGTIRRTQPNTYVSQGVIERVNNKTLRVRELPVGPVQKSFNWYKQYLNELENPKDKRKSVLSSWDDHVTTADAEFVLHFAGQQLTSWTDDKLLDQLKLRLQFSTTNMYLFDEQGRITKYDSVEQILRSFYTFRLRKYQERKQHMLRVLREKYRYLDAKIRFLEAIGNRQLVVYRRPVTEIVAYLEQQDFPRKADSYDYLTRMPINNFTEEHLAKLKEQRTATKDEIDELSRKPPEDMWLDDLDRFEQAYRRIYLK
jgi:DNA topoisomerase-2